MSYTNDVKHTVLGVHQTCWTGAMASRWPTPRPKEPGGYCAPGSPPPAWPPDPDDQGNPVGLVYLAPAEPDGTWVRKIQQGLGRERVRHVSASHAFDLTRRYLSGLSVW
ncbi:MAG: CinA family protein [Flavonifractor plautii]